MKTRSAWFLLGAALCPPIAAQLVPMMNPGFDTNLAGWTQVPPGSSTWYATDVDGCPGGRVVLGNDFDLVIKLHQCVLLSGVQPVSVLVRTSASSPDSAVLRASFFSDTACSSFLANDIATVSATAWTELRLDFSSPPPGTQSIDVSLEVVGDNVAPPLAIFDEVRLARAPLVFADSFESGSPCRW